MRIAATIAASVLASACVACVHGEGPSFTFSGTVLDENGNGVANASVSLPLTGMSTTSASNGAYAFTLSSQPNSVVLRAQAPGYVRTSRYVPGGTLNNYKQVAIMMRAQQNVRTVALPTAAGSTVVTQVPDADGGATLTISPNTLVTPSGQIATGNVQIAMTYWHPKKNLASIPGSLITSVSPGVTGLLETFGMADIEISQNGNLLQVASGQSLGLHFAVPPAQWLGVSARINTTFAQPNLYSLDMNTGFWQLEGTLANPNILTFNPNTGVFSANLPHLSAWNMDGMLTSEGGCVSGHAVNQQGNPATNVQVRVYFLDRDEVKDFVATTDGNGDYCVDTGYTPPDNYADEQVPYYVSGADSPSDSAQCNPMPAYCSNCQFEPLYCSNCASRSTFVCTDNGAELTAWGDNTCNALPTCNASSSDAAVVACDYRYIDGCSPQSPIVTITACHFCSNAPASCSAIFPMGNTATYETVAGTNGGCGQLNTVTLGATAPSGSGAGSGGNNNCPNGPLVMGASCNPAIVPTCCGPGLMCSDYLCVPIN